MDSQALEGQAIIPLKNNNIRMQITIINNSKQSLPEYSTEYSAKMDIRANIVEDIIPEPVKRIIVKTGLNALIPVGYEAQIRPRRGLAINNGTAFLNSQGTIDADYRGGVFLINLDLARKEFVIMDGERVCQMVIAKHERAEFKQADELIKENKIHGAIGHIRKH